MTTGTTITPEQSSSVKLELFVRETDNSFSTEPTVVSDKNALEFFRQDHTTIRFTKGHVDKDNFELATAMVFIIDGNQKRRITPQLKQCEINFLMVTSESEIRLYLPFSTPLSEREKFVDYANLLRSNFRIQQNPFCKILSGYDDTTPSVEYSEGKLFVDEFLRQDTDLDSAGGESSQERKTEESLPAETLVQVPEETQQDVAAVESTNFSTLSPNTSDEEQPKSEVPAGDAAKERTQEILAEIKCRMKIALEIPNLFSEIINDELPCDDADWDATGTAVLDGCDEIIRFFSPDSTNDTEENSEA